VLESAPVRHRGDHDRALTCTKSSTQERRNSVCQITVSLVELHEVAVSRGFFSRELMGGHAQLGGSSRCRSFGDMVHRDSS
jgi:hypothetical protein